jgi:hypothetical protein
MSLFKALVWALLITVTMTMKSNGDAPQMTLAAVTNPKMTLATVDNPKMTLAVVGYDAQAIHSISEMQSVFDRSDDAHQQSMSAISKVLTLPEALKALQNTSMGDNAVLKSVVGMISTGNQKALRSKQSGFGGLNGARDLLNDMIHESANKYDAEIAKCTDFYAKQCALMEVARGQISAANFQAATARALILDAEANIKKCEKDIPETKQELKDHNAKCKSELSKMNKRLKVIMGDIAIMTMILKMSDCDAKLLQMDRLALLRCEDQCSNTGNIMFNNKQLQDEVNHLQASKTQELLAATFADLFDNQDNSDLDNATLDDNDTFAFENMQLVQVEKSQNQSRNAKLMMLSERTVQSDSSDESKPSKCKCRVELYQHGGFKGWKAVYKCGAFGLMKGNKGFTDAGAKNDDASSIRVFGKGCKATVYKHGDFKGWAAQFTTGEFDIQQYKAHGAKNDDASAIKVQMDVKKPKIPFKRPPAPFTKVPPNPCTDPNGGGPSESDKANAKCTLKKSPRCYKLQGRFLQIQAGIEDQRDELMDQISKVEQSCEEMKLSLEASIENDNSLLSSSQTKLAGATEKEATAGETARQVAKENEGYNKDLVKMMKSCSKNYVDFETEICALKKIRGDLFKKMKAGHNGFFQDCEVSKWTPEACTKKCAGGEQKLIRSVLKHPGSKDSKGSKCLPLTAKKRCNMGPCPVDCSLAKWSGWNKCSSKCGGGVMQRMRDVKLASKYNGKPCGETTQTKQCNVEACSKDCVLKKWTKWTGCSKDCDGGSKKRVKFIKEPSEGSGKCAGEWDKERLQYKECNMKSCKVPDPKKVMKCTKSLDILLLMDGTPKSGEEGWKAEVKAANQFVDAFTGKSNPAKPKFAVIHYTGPRTWSGVSKCTGKSKKKVDQEKTCKVKIAQHFSGDAKKTKGTISGLAFQPGSKLLSLGMMTAQSEFALGRSNRKTVVVVYMDGQPLSYRKTRMAARALRKSGRLLFVIINKNAPLKDIKTWVSRRWQENLVLAEDPKELAEAATGTHVVANICPKESPKIKMKRSKKSKR